MLNHAVDSESFYRAVPWFRATIIRQPTNESSWRGLAWGLAGSGAEDAARQAWDNIPDAYSFFLQYALNALSSQEIETALIWLGRAQAARPEIGDAWYYAGTAYEAILDQTAAMAAYEQAAALRLNRVGLADVETRRARLWQSRGRAEAAFEAYQIAEMVDDFKVPYNRVLMLTGLGYGAFSRQACEVAISYFEEAITVDPTYGWAYFRLGQAVGLCCGDWESAASTIIKGLSYDPQNPWGYLYLGDTYAASGAVNQAQKAYEQALILSPNWTEAEAHLAALNGE